MQIIKALVFFSCVTFITTPHYANDTICVIEELSVNGGIATYRAKCCPAGEDFTFTGLPGMTLGTGCSGGHCRNEIKVFYGMQLLSVLAQFQTDDRQKQLFLADFSKLVLDLNNAATDSPITSSSTDVVTFLTQFLDISNSDLNDAQRKLLAQFVGKYGIRLTNELNAAPAIHMFTTDDDSSDDTNAPIPVHGFYSELEQFGYDDDPMPAQSTAQLDACLCNGANLVMQQLVKFNHPKKPSKEVFAQLVLVESPRRVIDLGGGTVTVLPKRLIGFGHEIERPTSMTDVVNVNDYVQMAPTCARHCVMVHYGSIFFGIGLAEHRND